MSLRRGDQRWRLQLSERQVPGLESKRDFLETGGSETGVAVSAERETLLMVTRSCVPFAESVSVAESACDTCSSGFRAF